MALLIINSDKIWVHKCQIADRSTWQEDICEVICGVSRKEGKEGKYILNPYMRRIEYTESTVTDSKHGSWTHGHFLEYHSAPAVLIPQQERSATARRTQLCVEEFIDRRSCHVPLVSRESIEKSHHPPS